MYPWGCQARPEPQATQHPACPKRHVPRQGAMMSTFQSAIWSQDSILRVPTQHPACPKRHVPRQGAMLSTFQSAIWSQDSILRVPSVMSQDKEQCCQPFKAQYGPKTAPCVSQALCPKTRSNVVNISKRNMVPRQAVLSTVSWVNALSAGAAFVRTCVHFSVHMHVRICGFKGR